MDSAPEEVTVLFQRTWLATYHREKVVVSTPTASPVSPPAATGRDNLGESIDLDNSTMSLHKIALTTADVTAWKVALDAAKPKSDMGGGADPDSTYESDSDKSSLPKPKRKPKKKNGNGRKTKPRAKSVPKLSKAKQKQKKQHLYFRPFGR